MTDLHMGMLGVPSDLWEQLPFVESENEAEQPSDGGNGSAEAEEYDGPRLGEMIKFSILVGPEGGIGAWPGDEGAIYIAPETAYQYRNGEWVDIDADTEEIFRSIATYVDPQEVRQRQQSGWKSR